MNGYYYKVTDGGELKANSKKTVEVLAEDDFPPRYDQSEVNHF